MKFHIEEFTQAIIKKRKEDNISLRDLAKVVGSTCATLSRLEHGQMTTIDTFCKVCVWLKKDPKDFLK